MAVLLRLEALESRALKEFVLRRSSLQIEFTEGREMSRDTLLFDSNHCSSIAGQSGTGSALDKYRWYVKRYPKNRQHLEERRSPLLRAAFFVREVS